MARVWVLGWPLALLVGTIAAHRAGGPVLAVAAFALVLAALPLQVARIAWRTRRLGQSWKLSSVYATLTMISKWFQVAGHIWYWLDRVSGRKSPLIEYKRVTPALRGGSAPQDDAPS
jgi:hypothetical protein